MGNNFKEFVIASSPCLYLCLYLCCCHCGIASHGCCCVFVSFQLFVLCSMRIKWQQFVLGNCHRSWHNCGSVCQFLCFTDSRTFRLSDGRGDYWTPPECGAGSDSDFGPVAAASVCNLRQFSLQT